MLIEPVIPPGRTMIARPRGKKTSPPREAGKSVPFLSTAPLVPLPVIDLEPLPFGDLDALPLTGASAPPLRPGLLGRNVDILV